MQLADLNSYEDEGQVLWQGNPVQKSDPDYHTALAATLGLQDHRLLSHLQLLGRLRERPMLDPRLRKDPDGTGRED
mgnify:CR=1 FL=1